MAIIDPDGLFHGERLAACSDIAQLYWPRFFVASNGYARLELSYVSIISKIFGSFQQAPEASAIWGVFEEYSKNCLAILYEHEGVWWAQFDTSAKYLPRFKTVRDEKSPIPPPEVMEKHRAAYLAWKSSNSIANESFRKSSEDFGMFLMERRGVGVGEGVGEVLSSATQTHASTLAVNEFGPIVERLFAYYCERMGRDPKRYTLTPARRKKAEMRLREREKLSDIGNAEIEAGRCIDNLASSDYHVSGGYIDWTDQIFRSAEEFEKRLSWSKTSTQGATRGKLNKTDGNDAAIQRFMESTNDPRTIDSRSIGNTGADAGQRPQQTGDNPVLRGRADAGEPSAVHPGVQPSAGDVPVLPQPGRTARLCFPA